MRGLGLGLGLALRNSLPADDYIYTNPETQALVARMTQPPSSNRKGIIDSLVGALKAANLWSSTKLPLLYVTWAHTEQAALLNWTQNLFNAGNGTNATFTQDAGFSGGSISTNGPISGASSADIGASQDSVHVGFYTSTSSSIVATDASQSITVAVQAQDVPRFRANAASYMPLSPSGVAPHHIVAIRRDALEQIGFRNGGSKTVQAGPSAALLGVASFGSGSTGRSTGIYHAGPGTLSDSDIAALYAAFNDYRVAIGA